MSSFKKCPLEKECDDCEWFVNKKNLAGGCAVAIIGMYFFLKSIKLKNKEEK